MGTGVVALSKCPICGYQFTNKDVARYVTKKINNNVVYYTICKECDKKGLRP